MRVSRTFPLRMHAKYPTDFVKNSCTLMLDYTVILQTTYSSTLETWDWWTSFGDREKEVPTRRRSCGTGSPGVAGYSAGSFPVNSYSVTSSHTLDSAKLRVRKHGSRSPPNRPSKSDQLFLGHACPASTTQRNNQKLPVTDKQTQT